LSVAAPAPTTRHHESEASAPDIPAAGKLDPALLSGWIELTDTERTMAELVARGLTNKETGITMCVSRHTVDCHLRQIYRKLGVNSRVELARVMGEHYEALDERARLGRLPG
jgi:DNA-binding CsgD family transcriptional regulator